MMNDVVIDGVRYVKAFEPSGEVIVRTYSAGVHIGTLKMHDGTVVTLTNARRLWKWGGAFTLNEVAMRGVDRSRSRISNSTSEVTLTQAIEIIKVSSGIDLSCTED